MNGREGKATACNGIGPGGILLFTSGSFRFRYLLVNPSGLKNYRKKVYEFLKISLKAPIQKLTERPSRSRVELEILGKVGKN